VRGGRRSRLGGLFAGLAGLALLAGAVLVGGPAGAADEDKADRLGLLPVYPVVTIDPAKGRAVGDPCYGEARSRRAAEREVAARQRRYDREARLLPRATTQDAVNERLRELAEARQALIDARYAEARCQLRLTNGGRGDKCKELWLEYNRIADRLAQQEEILRLREDDLARARRGGVASPDTIDQLDALAAAADRIAGDLVRDLAAQHRRIKADPDCKNTDFARPKPKAPAPKPRACAPGPVETPPSATVSQPVETAPSPTASRPAETASSAAARRPARSALGADVGAADAEADDPDPDMDGPWVDDPWLEIPDTVLTCTTAEEYDPDLDLADLAPLGVPVDPADAAELGLVAAAPPS
jgi:hypothetical protein